MAYNGDISHKGGAMSTAFKEEKLLELLTPEASTPIAEIAGRLYVSESTARRYVNELAKKGRVIRTHGGCMLSAAPDGNTPMYIRFSAGQADKKIIAEAAAEMIPDHATVFLDSSSTAFHMLPFLREKKGLTVVTSGLKTALALAEMNIRTMCIGGFIDPHNLSANSGFALEAVRQINADLFFFSCDALSDDGELTDNSYEESLLRREFMKYSAKKVLLIDGSKLHKKCRYNLGTLREIDRVICPELDDQ